MTDSTKDGKGNVTGEITPAEIAADKKANADQDTRPNIILTDALRTLRTQAGRHRK